MSLVDSARAIRRLIIERAFECGESTHIGGSLSIVEILTALFGQILKFDPDDPNWPDRDIFILSKGHCVLSYFAAMRHYGLMSGELFSTFQQNGSQLIAHPVKNLDIGVESSNGSLGQGLSFGLGVSLGMKLDKNLNRRVFVLMGDGECNEGSVWETAASAVEYGANNLVAIVDQNGFRNDGENSTYGDSRLAAIWRAFGWNVIEVDGHCFDEIIFAIESSKSSLFLPTVVLAKTQKGRGVSFMEDNNDWHHNRITAKTYKEIFEEWDA